jgi:hypothetical protein
MMLLCGLVSAQKTTGTASNTPQTIHQTPPQPPEVPKVPEMPANYPSPEIRMLTSFMTGNWTIEETFDHSESLPNGGEMKGNENIHPGPGGLSLVSDVRTTGALGNFTALRYMLWDPKAQKVAGYWQDSSAPVLLQFTGTWANNILTINWNEESNGKKTEYREIFTGFSPEGFQAVMENHAVTEAANKTAQAKPADWKRVMSAKYSKFAPGPGMWHPGVGPRPANLPPSTPPPSRPSSATPTPATPPPSGKPPAEEKPIG